METTKPKDDDGNAKIKVKLYADGQKDKDEIVCAVEDVYNAVTSAEEDISAASLKLSQIGSVEFNYDNIVFDSSASQMITDSLPYISSIHEKLSGIKLNLNELQHHIEKKTEENDNE